MYKATKILLILQKRKPKEPLIIETGNGVTTNKEKQVKIITNFFKNFFNTPSGRNNL